MEGGYAGRIRGHRRCDRPRRRVRRRGAGGQQTLRPTVASAEKYTTYECGLDPVGEGWAQTHVRYYVFAYLVRHLRRRCGVPVPLGDRLRRAGYGLVTLVEMVVFIGFLAIGIAYAWRRGVLRWV